MTFEPLDFLKVAVESGNISNVRAAISSYITKNPGNRNRELNDVLNYINKSKLSDKLWEEHIAKSGETKNKSQWTKDYFRMIRSNLRNNFSMDRMNHILEVGQYLYKDEVAQNESVRVINSTNSNKVERRIDKPINNKESFAEKVVSATKYLFTDDYTIIKKSNVVEKRRVDKR